MPMLPPTKTGIFFWTWKQTFQSLRKPATLLPFAGYATMQLLLLAGLFFFTYPPFSLTFLPLQKALYGEVALHYPNNFIVMPQMFEILNLVLAGVLGTLAIGRATVLFFNSGDTKSTRQVTTSASKHYIHLLGAWIVETALVLVVMSGFYSLSQRMPGMGIYITMFRVLMVIGVSALFAFPAALILIDKKPFWAALPQSVKLSGSYALITFLLIGLPTLLQLPVDFLVSNSARIARKLNPEVIAGILAIGIFVAMVSNYFIVGTVTHLYRAIKYDTEVAGASMRSKSEQQKRYVH
jgi:hypothetical protein